MTDETTTGGAGATNAAASNGSNTHDVRVAPSAIEGHIHAGPPPAQPTPPAAQATGGVAHDINTDIANILKGIKLPEKRSADTVPKFGPIGGTAKLTPPTREEEMLASTTPMSKDSLVQPMTLPTQAPIPAMHTFKDDVQHVVREKKISIVRAATLEQDRQSREPQPATEGSAQRSQRFSAILFASGLLFLLGCAALFGVYFVMTSTAGTSRTPLDTSLVFAEQTATLSITGLSPLTLKGQISQARESSTGSIGSITHVVPTLTTNPADAKPVTRPATTAEFFRAIGVHAPEELTNALGEQFFFGIHTVDTNAPFFVIPVVSYEHAFAGMLAWELSINDDLAPLFPAVSATILDSNGIPTRRSFQDSVLRNFDVRTLKGDRGETVLYYSFPSPSLLIIGESPYTFTEILSRLQSAHRL